MFLASPDFEHARSMKPAPCLPVSFAPVSPCASTGCFKITSSRAGEDPLTDQSCICARFRRTAHTCRGADVPIFAQRRMPLLNPWVLFCTAACNGRHPSRTMEPHPDVGEGAKPATGPATAGFFVGLHELQR